MESVCSVVCQSHFFGVQDRHFNVRTSLVNFINNNPSYFINYCLLLTGWDHVRRMKNNFVWGSQVEIFAVSLYFSKPVFVATCKTNQEYYWAKYQMLSTHIRESGVQY